MWTDSKVGFTWWVLKLGLFLHLHILPEVWVVVSNSIPWDLNQALRFFSLLDLCAACFLVPTQSAGDPWLGRKCLSKQCCPAILPAWCSKPASFLSTEEGLWWEREGIQDCTLMGTQKLQELWERELISDPQGLWQEQRYRIQRGQCEHSNPRALPIPLVEDSPLKKMFPLVTLSSLLSATRLSVWL